MEIRVSREQSPGRVVQPWGSRRPEGPGARSSVICRYQYTYYKSIQRFSCEGAFWGPPRAFAIFAVAAQKHAKTRANAALGPLGAQNGLLRPARVPPVRSKGLFEPASAPLVRSRWPLWPAPEPPVRSERLIELAWAPPVRSKWPVWHAPVLVSVLKEAVRACFGAASALKEAFRACCSRSLFAKAGLGCTVL